MTETKRFPELKPQNTGLKNRCPRCGQGLLFSGFLRVADHCKACKLDYSFADSGDGPAFFVMFFAMVPTLAFMLWMETVVGAPIWLNILLTIPFVLAVTLLPLRMLKGLMIAQQFVQDARQGTLDMDE